MKKNNSNEQPNYYAILPSSVRYDNRLKPNEKLLYSEITALSNKTGLCYATNKYFADLYEVENETISRWIKHLKELQYIDVEIIYKEETKEIDKRVIKINGIPIDKNINTYIPNNQEGYCENNQEGIDKKVKENNTSINNTSMNIKENIKRKVFKKPTVEELKEYCISASLSVDYQYFYDYYESNGWKVGKNLMKDWKATLRNWNRRNNQSKKETSSNYEVGKIYEYDGVKYTFNEDGKKCILSSQ